MPRTGAELLVESLVAAGIKHLLSLSGNHVMPIYDATIGRDINLIHTRHEAAAVHMADAWGRLTGQPGVALVTAGPGHCNALSALYVALMAESPLVLLSGHAPLQRLGQGSFQEIDQVTMAKPVTKAAWLVKKVDDLERDLAKALRLANEGRPGPVHLSLPTDVLEATGPDSHVPSIPLDEETRNASSPSHNGAIEEILNHLAEAKRPIILAGPAMGRSPRWSEVEALSNILNIPALPMESPRGVNDPWLHFATNNLAEADLVLLLGKKVDFTLKFGQSPFFAPKCRFVQIDADQSQLIEGNQVILGSWNDPLGIVRQLTVAAQGRKWASTSWPNEVQTAQKTLPAEWDPLFESSAVPIHPLRVCGALQPFLKEDATLISDGGEFGQWAQAGLEAHTRLINGPSGSIGSSLPMGLGAKLAHPEHRVFVALGDGTFGFHALEFDTALRYNLPIIAVIGNDARWNAEHQLQLQNYGEERTVGCDLLPSRYDKLVTSLGGHGEFVQHPDELGSAFERAMASELPACVNILIESVGAPTFRLNKA